MNEITRVKHREYNNKQCLQLLKYAKTDEEVLNIFNMIRQHEGSLIKDE